MALLALAAVIPAGCGGMRRDRSGVAAQQIEQYVSTAPAAFRRPADERVECPAVIQVTPTTAPTTAPRSATTQVVEAKAIQINDRYITLCEIIYPINEKLKSLADTAGGEAQFRAGALGLIREEARHQVEQTLLLNEAEGRVEEHVQKAIDEEVEAALRRALAQVGGSATRLAEELRGQGTDLETWKRDLRRNHIVRWYVQQRMNPKIVVTRRMMWDYYRAHPDEFRKAGRVRMQIVAAPFAAFAPKDRQPTTADLETARTEARKTIDQAAAELAAGKPFEDVAKRLCRGAMAAAGGLWPMMEKGSFRIEKVEQAAFAQPAGAVSGVVETADGFYIVKTHAREDGQDVPFERAQDGIEQTLREQQYRKYTMEYLQGLRGKTTIVAADGFEDTAVRAAVDLFYRH